MFVQFLHDQLLKLSGLPNGGQWPVAPAYAALRAAAFLSDDPIYVPTVDLVQSPMAEPLMKPLQRLAEANLLRAVGSSVSLDDLQRSKQEHFRRTQMLPVWEAREAYERLERFQASLQARSVPTTAQLRLRWMEEMGRFVGSAGGGEDTPLTRRLRQAAVLLEKPPKRVSGAFSMVPKRLESNAFLWSVVEELRLLPFRTEGEPRRLLEIGLAWHWVTSHLEEYRTSMLINMRGIGAMSFAADATHQSQVLDSHLVDEALRLLRLHQAFSRLEFEEILALRLEPTAVVLRDFVLLPLATGSLHRPLMALAERVREAVADATTGFRAFQKAGALVLGEHPHELQAKRPYRVGVVIALSEELLLMREAVEAAVGPLEVEDSPQTGQTIFRAKQFTNERGLEIELFFALIGKGPERAAARTGVVMTEQQPDMLVNVGIAGALKEDLALADVAIADKLESYLDNSKAEADGDGGFLLALDGQPVTTDTFLLQLLETLPFRAGELLRQRREQLQAEASKFLTDPDLVGEFGFLSGAVASGPTVGANEAFTSWLHQHSRAYMALEMEASGAGIAADAGGRIERVRYLVLRGISDYADQRKNDLEKETKGAVRRLATVAPLTLLMVLLQVLDPATIKPRRV